MRKMKRRITCHYLYNCDAIPFYVLIDKEGKVVAKWEHIGDVQLKELDMLIK